MLGLTLFQVGVLECIGAMFCYFVIYSENGFLPLRVIGLRDQWTNAAITNLEDSFGQEWASDSS